MSNANNSCIPRLRFPGFTGEWEEKKLGEVATFKRGMTITAKDTKNGDVPVIAGGQTPSYYHNVSNREGETIAISGSGAYAGFVSYWNTPVFLSDSFSVETEIDINKKYAFYYLKHKQQDLFFMQKGAGVPHVHGTDVGNLIIPLPSLPEQQKIASCLSELDNLIAAQNQKVDALKEKKKGLMQQLFPQPGETTPRLRFPGFEGEWVEKKLGEMAEFVNGMAFKPSDWIDKGLKIVRIQNLNDEKAPFNYCNPDIANENCLIDTGDLLFSWSGTPGTSFGAFIWNRGKAVLNQHIFIVYPLNCVKLFLKSVFDASMDIIIEHAHGGAGLRHITKSDLESIKAFFPSSLSEQERIASCLSSLDDLIAAESAKVEALKDHKKGLMQQLFPQPTK